MGALLVRWLFIQCLLVMGFSILFTPICFSAEYAAQAVEVLLEKLGAEDFNEREQAQQALVANAWTLAWQQDKAEIECMADLYQNIQKPVEAALKKVLDPEIKKRLQDILPRIQGRSRRALVLFNAAACLRQFDIVEEREHWLQEVIGELAVTEVDAAKAMVKDLQTEESRQSAWADILDSIAAQDHLLATNLLESRPNSESFTYSYFRVARLKAKSAPKEAWEWACNLKNEKCRISALEGVLFTTAKSELDAAIRKAETLEPGVFRDSAFIAIASAISKAKPEAAATLLERVGGSKFISTDHYAVVEALRKTDLIRAVNLAAMYETPEVDSDTLISLVRDWAVKDYNAAKEWVKDSHKKNKQGYIVQDRGTAGLALALWNSNREEAEALLKEVGVRSALRNVYALIAEEMVAVDFNKALAWVRGLPKGQRYDFALEGLATAAVEKHPKEVCEEVLKMESASKREKLLFSLIRMRYSQGLDCSDFLPHLMDSSNVDEARYWHATSLIKRDAKKALEAALLVKRWYVRGLALKEIGCKYFQTKRALALELCADVRFQPFDRALFLFGVAEAMCPDQDD